MKKISAIIGNFIDKNDNIYDQEDDDDFQRPQTFKRSSTPKRDSNKFNSF
jgi:hypothetical protein